MVRTPDVALPSGVRTASRANVAHVGKGPQRSPSMHTPRPDGIDVSTENTAVEETNLTSAWPALSSEGAGHRARIGFAIDNG